LKTVGIVCEYNPLHKGHRKQLRLIRQTYGADCGIICLMSGNFVQRGAPAIVDKSVRAEAAVRCGADLVLELPVTRALSSAEGFAHGGVEILSRICDTLCFGAENPDDEALMTIARVLLSEGFPPALKAALEKGCSFPAARQAALAQMGVSSALLTQPNNILAVEYCKAILSQESKLDIFPIGREGSYHAEIADYENPSATAVRSLMLCAHNWRSFVPRDARELFQSAPLHSLPSGERAVLAKLRTMTEGEFEALPYGSEGLWRKLMHASREENTLEDILTAAKSKRYTRSRLDRMVMCAFLGITKDVLDAPVPYTRVLAFNDRGRTILREFKKEGFFLNPGEKTDHPFWPLEKQWGDLYGLFRTDGIDPPGSEENRRVVYIKSELQRQE